MIRQRMGLKTYRLFTIVVFFILSLSFWAQDTIQTSFPFTVRSYDSHHGLPQNQILNIIQGKENIIISTMNGLSMFNGHQFSPFLNNKKTKTSAYKELICNKKNRTLYGLTTQYGYRKIFPVEDKIGDYNAIANISDTLFAISTDGIIQIQNLDATLTYEIIKTNIDHSIRILPYGNDIYVISYDALYKINRITQTTVHLLDDEFTVLTKNPFNHKIVAIGKKMYELSRGEIQSRHISEYNDKLGSCWDIEFIDTNEFMITSKVGLYYVKDGKTQLYTTADGLIANSLYEIFYYKPEDCFFIGTENSGLMVLTKRRVKTYFTDSKSSDSQSFTSVVKDDTGWVYSVASFGDFIRIKDGIKENYMSIFRDVSSINLINNKFYVGTWGTGVFIYQNKKLIDSLFPPIIPPGAISSIFQDKKDNIWISTTEGIAIQYPNKAVKIISREKGRAISMYQLKNGNVCVGKENELLIFDKFGDIITRYGSEDGLICKQVRAFYEDEKGRLWIGTYVGGLYVLDNQKITSINNLENCILKDDIFTLARIDDGNLYMASNNGLWSIPEAKLFDFYENKIDYLIPQLYGKDVGIINLEFNGGFQSNYNIVGDKIFFPTIYGLIEFEPKNHVLPYIQRTTTIQSIFVNDSLKTDTDNTIFDKETFSIKFNFYTPSYTEGYNIYYSYRLEGKGIDRKWSVFQKENNVTFRALSPGNYIFHVRSLDCFNDNDPSIVSYSFTIRPYFYETNWFIGLSILFSAAVLLLIFYQILRREAERNKLNSDNANMKLKVVQSRMNPHFIFNAVNNINYLLDIQEYSKAEDMLNEFSQLMRKFLENSNDVNILLGSELEMINLYIGIQQKRYNYNFEYSINCPKDLHKMDIPTLLIQPFVENAIIHGIHHSNQHCHLRIDISKNKNYLVIEIEDSGIGIAKSKEINKSRTNHNSYGIELIKEKILIMRNFYKTNITYTIENSKNFETGTLVVVKIQIKGE